MNKIASNKIPNIGDSIKGQCIYGPKIMRDISIKVTEIISVNTYTAVGGGIFVETKVNNDIIIVTQIGWRYY